MNLVFRSLEKVANKGLEFDPAQRKLNSKDGMKRMKRFKSLKCKTMSTWVILIMTNQEKIYILNQYQMFWMKIIPNKIKYHNKSSTINKK